MNPLPDRLNLDHLKKQAKQLIRLYRSRDAAAMARFRSALPATAGLSDDDISSRQLRLHDAQSCIAREHGFASWPDLKRYVEVQAVAQQERAVRVLHWLRLIYSRRRQRHVQPRQFARRRCGCWPKILDLFAGDPYLACAIGDETRVAAGNAGRSVMGQPAGRPAAIAAAVRGRAFEPAADGGVS